MVIKSVTFKQSVDAGPNFTVVDALYDGEKWDEVVVRWLSPRDWGVEINVSGCRTLVPWHNVKQVFYY